MPDSQPASDPELSGVPRPGGNGGPGGPLRPLDRSGLLRRSTRFPFDLGPTPNGIRIRRQRRVSDSFTGIPPLSRIPDQEPSDGSSRD